MYDYRQSDEREITLVPLKARAGLARDGAQEDQGLPLDDAKPGCHFRSGVISKGSGRETRPCIPFSSGSYHHGHPPQHHGRGKQLQILILDRPPHPHSPGPHTTPHCPLGFRLIEHP